MEIVIKPLTHKQLAASMGISTRVLHTFLQPLQKNMGKRKGYYYSLEQMLIIYAHLGIPSLLQQTGFVIDLPLIEYPIE